MRQAVRFLLPEPACRHRRCGVNRRLSALARQYVSRRSLAARRCVGCRESPPVGSIQMGVKEGRRRGWSATHPSLRSVRLGCLTTRRRGDLAARI
jgi:hypothetical protein